MEVKFLKHKVEFLIMLIIMPFVSIFLISMSFIDFTNMWPSCAVGIIALLILLYAIFIDKKFSSNVIFSEEGIEYKSFKKSILFIAWDDITEIKRTPRSAYSEWITFVARDKKIDVSITKKCTR